MIDRRRLISAGAVSAIAAGAAGSTERGPAPSRTIDVRDFGAMGDGKADDTAAFNRACQASAPWSEDLCYAIRIPAGRYRLDGSVYVRKGQSVLGEGQASYIDAQRATASTFILGRRGIDGSSTPDPGGAPIRLNGIRAIGGAPAHGFIVTDAQGFSITDIFLTAVGIGIEITGSQSGVAADGIIHNATIDQCLQGIMIKRAQNIIFNSINIYRPRFGITVLDGSSDLIFSDVIISYTEYASLTLGQGSISNVTFADSTFISNAQHETFISNILARSSSGDFLFSGCTFRNWPTTSVIQDAPGAIDMVFSGCIFDGARTSERYTQGQSSAVLATGSNGRFSFQGCQFRNLPGAIARLPGGHGELRISGGKIENCGEQRLIVSHAFSGKIDIREVSGFAPQISAPRRGMTTLPLWPNAGPWRICVRLNEPTVFCEEAVVHRSTSRSGTAVTRLAGWRTADDRQLRFALIETANGPMLQATIDTDEPANAHFSAETVC